MHEVSHAHIFPAVFKTFVPTLETNIIHTMKQIHIVIPSKHFMAFITPFLQKQLLLSWTG